MLGRRRNVRFRAGSKLPLMARSGRSFESNERPVLVSAYQKQTGKNSPDPVVGLYFKNLEVDLPRVGKVSSNDGANLGFPPPQERPAEGLHPAFPPVAGSNPFSPLRLPPPPCRRRAPPQSPANSVGDTPPRIPRATRRVAGAWPGSRDSRRRACCRPRVSSPCPPRSTSSRPGSGAPRRRSSRCRSCRPGRTHRVERVADDLPYARSRPEEGLIGDGLGLVALDLLPDRIEAPELVEGHGPLVAPALRPRYGQASDRVGEFIIVLAGLAVVSCSRTPCFARYRVRLSTPPRIGVWITLGGFRSPMSASDCCLAANATTAGAGGPSPF